MDQKKTGYFLKQLRNEKKLTQEQLAEKFQITSRTVSRWETGSNMPDISMLLELADFYEVDIREIIDGERKSEQMNEELKETVIKVTDYTETNNARLLKRVRIIGITGVITILIAMVMDAGGLAVSPFWESVKRDLYAWTLGTLIANILYTTGWLKRISEKKDVSRKMRISGVVCAVIVIMSLILRLFYRKTHDGRQKPPVFYITRPFSSETGNGRTSEDNEVILSIIRILINNIT